MKKRIMKITLYFFIIFSALCINNITTYAEDNYEYEESYDNDSDDDEDDSYDDDNENEEKGGGWFNFNPGEMIKNWILEELIGVEKEGIKIDQMFFKNVLYPENNITILKTFYNEFSRYVKSISLSVIILYLLWYGFKVYILWKDGNPEENPKELLIRFTIAIAYMMTYEELINIVNTLISAVINNLLSIGNTVGSAYKNGVGEEAGLGMALLGLIFIIIYFFQYWKMMFGTIKMGIELYVLRLGTPLACINIVQPNGNTWSNYITTFIKDYLGICLNVMLMIIGTKIFDSRAGVGQYQVLWAAAFLSLANGSKDLLNQFIVSSSNNMSGHSIGSMLNYGNQVRNMITKQAVKGAATGGAGVAIPPTP